MHSEKESLPVHASRGLTTENDSMVGCFWRGGQNSLGGFPAISRVNAYLVNLYHTCQGVSPQVSSFARLASSLLSISSMSIQRWQAGEPRANLTALLPHQQSSCLILAW